MKGRQTMLVIGIILIVLALLIAIVPQFTECQPKDMSMSSTPNAMASTPECNQSARAELVVGVLLLIVGIGMVIGKRRETQMVLSVLGMAMGIAALLMPTLIGTCSSPAMICNTVMKPSLLILGSLAVITSIVGLVVSIKMKDN